MNTNASSAWTYGGALLLVLMVAAGGAYLVLSNFFGRGELGTKSDYAALQGVEIENRTNKNPGLILKSNVNGSGLDVLGVPGADAAGTRVWIILNKQSPEGSPLLMPQEIPLKSNCDSINEAISGSEIVDAARRYLLKNCIHHS